MTVPSQVNKSGPYTENGVTTVFAYQFKIDDETHIMVVRSVDGVETVLALGTDYTVTGVGDPTGNVVMNVPGDGSTLMLLRKAPFTQELELENQGPYFAKDVERALDLAVMRDQELSEQISRSVKVPVSADPTDLETLVGGILALTPIHDDIQTVAGISGQVVTVAGLSTEVATVAGIAAHVVTVAGISADVSTVAAAAANVATVAGNIADVNTVAGISGAVSAVAGISADVTAVAGIKADVTAVAGALPILIDTATVLNAVVRHDVAQTLGASAQGQARANIGAASRVDTRRNRIVNGDMRVSQENGTVSGTSNGYYPVDQWAQYRVTSAGVLTVAQVASVTPAGSPNRLRATVTTADASLAAGEYWTLTQNLEGSNVADFLYGGASAKDAVPRFGFKGPAGTYAVHLGNSAANRSFVALFTISAGEANTDTVQEIAIPGDTTGTWLTTDGVIGITLDIVLACGSTFQGSEGWQSGNILGTSAVSNGMAVQGAVFELFDVGLKLDPNATGVYGQYEVGEVDAVYRSERYARRRSGRRLASGPIDSAGHVWVSESIGGVVMCKPPVPTFGTAEALSFGVGWVPAYGPALPNGDTPSTVDTISYYVAAYATGTPFQCVAAYADWLLLSRLS